jgi:hypothetical protein
MNSDAASQAKQEPAPDREPVVLHLSKLVPGATADGSPEGEITAFVAKAAAETVQESPTPLVLPNGAGSLPPESMLGVVSYCYVKGIYGSEDIGCQLNQDAKLRAACRDQLPRPDEIRRFRRLNRAAIQKTLEKVLKLARQKVAEVWAPSNPFRGESTVPGATGLEADTQASVSREAAERVDRATFIDGMSM